MELHDLTVSELYELLRTKQASSLEITSAVLDRIREIDGRIGAYLTVDSERALLQAREADKRLRRGQNVTPLTGIPFAVKDCISTAGVRTTAGSRILEHYTAEYDATVIQRLKEHGAVLLGKTNMDEFGMGSSCENSAFHRTRNPWDHSRVPGGSSGGSAAAVAARLAPFTLGEDTGGSIRMPAAFCGIVGLKPTYGRVSRYGLIALASSFDCIGPMTRTVQDCALVLASIAGHDPHDSTSLRASVGEYARNLGDDISGMRLGVPKEYFEDGMDPGVAETLQRAIQDLRDLGAVVEETSLPHTRYAIPVYYLILFAEASANLARFDGTRYGLSVRHGGGTMLDTYLETRGLGFGAEVKRRIMMGAFALSSGYHDAYYLKAQRVRSLLKRDFETAFTKYDALVTPVCPTTAFKLGEKVDDPLAMYLSDVYVTAVNPSGVPALTLPCGFDRGMPVGMQLIGRPLGEQILFKIAHAYERHTPWHRAVPSAA